MVRRNLALLVLLGFLAGACSRLGWDDVGRAARGARGAREVVMPAPGTGVANPPGREFIVEAEALAPEEQLRTFSVPPGFDVQLVAAEPAIQKPMQLAFDERGRLLVSMSTNYPLGPPPDGPPSDQVKAIEIDGLTGAATRITTLAEGFNICSGIEALPGERVVLGHAPDILVLSDGDGDGALESREVLYTGFDRADTHELPNSFTWGPDGWVYFLQGHVNESDVRDRDGEVTAIHHGGVFRFRTDGSAIEVYAPGMSNPWGLTLDHEYNMFGADCESKPLWQIVEGFRYQGFLQPNDPLGFAPHITEDPHGASGFAGLVSYTATAFPEAYRDCLYLGGPITHRIHRDALRDAGSTRHAVRMPDLLMSDDPWFRPVDVELGPDGALYVADWYNRIIAHVEVPLDHPARDKQRGRIWRIVYRGTEAEWADVTRRREISKQFEGPMATNWGAAPKQALLDALGDPNGWIRRQASQQLAYRFPDRVVAPLRGIVQQTHGDSAQRVEALWLLHRLDALTWDDLLPLFEDADAYVRAQSVRVAGLLETDDHHDTLIAMTIDDDAAVRREAMLAVAKAPTRASFEQLIDSPPIAKDDTLLEYGRRHALREHLRDDAILNAWDAVPGDEEFLRLLAAAQTPAAAGRLVDRLEAGDVPNELMAIVLESVLFYADAERVEDHFITNSALHELPVEQKHTYAWMLLHRSGRAKSQLELDFDPVLARLAAELAATGDSGEEELALEIAAARSFVGFVPLARATIANPDASDHALRYAAMLLVSQDFEASGEKALQMVADASQPRPLRRYLAKYIAQVTSTRTQLDALIEALSEAPADVNERAYEQLASTPEGAAMLLDAVERGAVTPTNVNAYTVRAHFERPDHAALRARFDALASGAVAPDAEARVLVEKYEKLYPERASANVRRGQEVFEANCMVCHRVRGLGALRAPNLDGIGNRGVARVLQDVLMPSHDVDPAFRTTVVKTTSGLRVEGLVAEETPERILMVDRDGWETPIATNEIEERRQVWMSPMPSGFGTLLPESDVLDLTAFLMNPPERVEAITQ